MTTEEQKMLDGFTSPACFLDTNLSLVYANESARINLPELCVNEELSRRIDSNIVMKSALVRRQCTNLLLDGVPLTYRFLSAVPMEHGYLVTFSSSCQQDYPERFCEMARDSLSEIFASLPLLSKNLQAPEGDRQLRRVNQACYQNLRSVSMLSYLAKIGSGALQPAQVDFPALLAALCQAFNSLALPGVPQLSCRVPEAPLVVACDPELLAVMAENLIANALRFSHDENSITVTLTQLSGRVLLRVRDTGTGIRPDVLPHIFEPYFSAGIYPEDPAPGLGLGLTFVHLLAGLLGGSVTAESEYGEGTCVAVALPLAEEEENAPPMKNFLPDFMSNRYSSFFVQLGDFCRLPEI